MIGTDGELLTGFDFNDQAVYHSCGVTHENSLFLYGDNLNKRQVLQVIDCGLSSIGILPFDHYVGACDSANGLILLCFDYNDTKQCRQARTPLGPWSEMMPSTYNHRATQIATSPGNLIDCRYLKHFFYFRQHFSRRLSYARPHQGRAL